MTDNIFEIILMFDLLEGDANTGNFFNVQPIQRRTYVVNFFIMYSQSQGRIVL